MSVKDQVKEAKKQKKNAKYIGTLEVLAHQKVEDVNLVGVLLKTPDGQEIEENFTIDQFDRLVEDEPYSNQEVFVRRYETAIKKIYDVLIAERVSLHDAENTLFAQVARQLDNHLSRVTANALGLEDGQSPKRALVATLHACVEAIDNDTMESDSE